MPPKGGKIPMEWAIFDFFSLCEWVFFGVIKFYFWVGIGSVGSFAKNFSLSARQYLQLSTPVPICKYSSTEP